MPHACFSLRMLEPPARACAVNAGVVCTRQPPTYLRYGWQKLKRNCTEHRCELPKETEESGATEEEATGGRTTRVGRPRGGMRVAARIGDRLRREIRRGRRPRVGDG